MADNNKNNAAKKPSTQTKSQRDAASAASSKSSSANAGGRGNESTASAVMPYVLMVFALILGICFFNVQLLEISDGAGVIGFAMQWIFCGFLGSAAFLLPVVLFYIGLRNVFIT